MENRVKKSAMDLTDIAIGVLILGIVVTIGAYILTNFRDNRLDDLPLVTTSNEITPATDAGHQLDNTWVSSVNSIINTSGGETVGTGNYTTTVDTVGGYATIDFVGASPYNGTNVNVSYSWYNTSQADYALANNASLGIAEYGNWFDIIVIVGVAALVLSLIFMAFGRSSNSGGVSY